MDDKGGPNEGFEQAEDAHPEAGGVLDEIDGGADDAEEVYGIAAAVDGDSFDMLFHDFFIFLMLKLYSYLILSSRLLQVL